MSLSVLNLRVAVEGKQILHGVSLNVAAKTVHAVMGPNGSGKSTFANAISGHPRYSITDGSVTVDGSEVASLSPDERARAGLFLSFQNPVEVAGVPVRQFLRTAYNALRRTQVDPIVFSAQLKKEMERMQFDPSFANRSLNDGFSGGERKRLEMLQLALLQPKYAILDETDSGLDVDAIKNIAHTITRAKDQGIGVLLITHYSRILRFVIPDVVHILIKGKIVQSGDASLAQQIEEHGYESFQPSNNT